MATEQRNLLKSEGKKTELLQYLVVYRTRDDQAGVFSNALV